MKRLFFKMIAINIAFITASLFLFACDRTLTSKEVNKIFEKIQTAVETETKSNDIHC